jgi:hypothetical protein
MDASKAGPTQQAVSAVNEATKELCEVMAYAAKTSYRRFPEKFGGVGILLAVLGAFAMFPLQLFVLEAGIAGITKILISLPVFLMMSAPLYDVWSARLTNRFASAQRSLARASDALPRGPQKAILKAFNKSAGVLFRIGQAAVRQREAHVRRSRTPAGPKTK